MERGDTQDGTSTLKKKKTALGHGSGTLSITTALHYLFVFHSLHGITYLFFTVCTARTEFIVVPTVLSANNCRSFNVWDTGCCSLTPLVPMAMAEKSYEETLLGLISRHYYIYRNVKLLNWMLKAKNKMKC